MSDTHDKTGRVAYWGHDRRDSTLRKRVRMLRDAGLAPVTLAFDRGEGELSDAASALDWLQTHNPNASACWIAGFSFGAWIGMQLLMRRPEITGFISVSPPANMYDFSFLAPCPSSGLIINGSSDRVAPPADTTTLVGKLQEQKGITVTHEEVSGAGHFFEDPYMDPMIETVTDYVKRRLTESSR